jgi:type I site-specific restriction endonuclease
MNEAETRAEQIDPLRSRHRRDRGAGGTRHRQALQGSDFNTIIEIKQREQQRVEIVLGQIDRREKTLVFCANQDHALAIRDLIHRSWHLPLKRDLLGC